MLILTRRWDQRIMIGEDIVITVMRIDGDQVRLGISAPRSIPVHREEVLERIERERGYGVRPAASSGGGGR